MGFHEEDALVLVEFHGTVQGAHFIVVLEDDVAFIRGTDRGGTRQHNSTLPFSVRPPELHEQSMIYIFIDSVVVIRQRHV